MQVLQLIFWEVVQVETLHSSSLQKTFLEAVHSKLRPLEPLTLYYQEQQRRPRKITMRWQSLIFHREDRRRRSKV